MIELPDRNDALCFNINDKPGTIFNLVRDPVSGQTWAAFTCSQHLCRFLRPMFVFRYFGQWPDYWRQENPPWWCHQHILLPLWHHPLDSGGEAGGEHRVHHSVSGRRKDQDVVVCTIVSERSQVSVTGSSTSGSLCLYFISIKLNVIPLSSLAWIFCWLRIVAWW